MVVDCYPGIVILRQQIAVIVEVEDIIHTQIDESFAIIHPDIQSEPVDQAPLIFIQTQDLMSVDLAVFQRCIVHMRSVDLGRVVLQGTGIDRPVATEQLQQREHVIHRIVLLLLRLLLGTAQKQVQELIHIIGLTVGGR